MKKIDKFLILLYLALMVIILILLSIISDSLDTGMTIGFCVILYILLTARSFHLENYLRKIESKGKLGYLEHLSGLLNNRKKLIGLAGAVRPVFEKNEYNMERNIINILTVLIYLEIFGFISISILFKIY